MAFFPKNKILFSFFFCKNQKEQLEANFKINIPFWINMYMILSKSISHSKSVSNKLYIFPCLREIQAETERQNIPQRIFMCFSHFRTQQNALLYSFWNIKICHIIYLGSRVGFHFYDSCYISSFQGCFKVNMFSLSDNSAERTSALTAFAKPSPR